jgi:hypothetical protein
MGRKAGYHAKEFFFRQYGEFPAGKYAGVYAAENFKAEKAVFMGRHDKAQFVYMGVKEQFFCPRFSAGNKGDNIAKGVPPDSTVRSEQLFAKSADLAFKARRPAKAAEFEKSFFYIHIEVSLCVRRG